MTDGSDQAQATRFPAVLAALQEAAAGRPLRVEPQADQYGASVTGPLVEAYVMLTRDGGLQVDLWRHDGDDPYRTVTGPDIADATRLAVSEASTGGGLGVREPRTNDFRYSSRTDSMTEGEGSCHR